MSGDLLASVKLVAIERAIKLLNAAGAQFHIKCEGMEFGAAIVPPKPPRQKRMVVNKGIGAFVKSAIGDMQIGDTRVVASDIYSLDHLQSCCASFCGALWGKGNYVTQRNPDKHGITVLRVE